LIPVSRWKRSYAGESCETNPVSMRNGADSLGMMNAPRRARVSATAITWNSNSGPRYPGALELRLIRPNGGLLITQSKEPRFRPGTSSTSAQIHWASGRMRRPTFTYSGFFSTHTISRGGRRSQRRFQ
jgi:hypothetical protein